jgi:hypothetical protein
MEFSGETEFNINDVVYYRQKTSEGVNAVFRGCVYGIHIRYYKDGNSIKYEISAPGAGIKIINSKDVFSTPDQAFN